MKRKIFYCSFILTVLLMVGCSGNNDTPTQPSKYAAAEESTSSTGETTTQPASADAKNSNTMISPEEAKSIALQHANFVPEEVTFSKCELDRVDNLPDYDVEFYTEDHLEYDYEIDAYTGEILSYEWEDDDIILSE